MAQPVRLEDFGDGLPGFVPEKIDGSQLEAEKLAAFDKGYAAGWDDATAAAAADRDTNAEAARTALRDLGFTFHEARAHVMLAMTPLLTGIVGQVLPKLVQDTIGQRLVEELSAMADEAGDAPVNLLVPAGDGPAMQEILSEVTALPLTVSEEPSLAEGQLYLRLGDVEREIDLTAMGDRIADAISALDAINKEGLANE